MKGKTAIVTGASRGIGRAVALALAEEGANVVINYAGNEGAASETAALCQEHGVQTLVVRGDVASSEDCTRLVEEAVKTFGTVDILVNNAGITRDNVLMRMSDEEFDQVIATNLRGTYLMMKAVSRTMMKKRYGRIVNMASVVGLMGNAGQVNYAASKAGVIGMTKSFAREIAARGITVNAVAPGFIATDMTANLPEAAASAISASIPKGTLGSPEDVANAVKFLASDQSGYITGQVICVDGGMCMM
ncbi:3-oxoacyl-[acyl-carrier-protein] reductase FabG [uncultured Eubacterium sp.]|uniref:3-oxoacyl-[acyl-carrier-protein] reductase n=1 Tax=Emergencia sp. TaxID=1926557 RepID=UPI0008225FB2|nr:3-oxoacyl-[acyl-carrier-protein] reductase FabG [uncultured Eubacterium sp.]